MLVFLMFQSSTIFVFQKWEHKEKKWNIENLTQIQYILVQYSDPICKLFYNFVNLLLIYTHFNGNYQIKTKKILNACKNKTSHANMQIRKKLGISVGPLIYDNVTKRKMTSAKSDYNILFIKGG